MATRLTTWGRSLVVAATMAAAGCASQPSIYGAKEVSVKLDSGSDFALDLINSKDPETTPGRMATEGVLMASYDCFDPSAPGLSFLLMPICAAAGAAVGGTTGAVISRNTIPPNEAVALRRATRQHGSGLVLKTQLEARIKKQGQDRGKTLVAYPGGAGVWLAVENLEWHISLGNRAAIVGDFEVVTGSDGEFAKKRFRVSSVKLPVDEWAADSGERVRAELEAFAAAVSLRLWEIIDRDVS